MASRKDLQNRRTDAQRKGQTHVGFPKKGDRSEKGVNERSGGFKVRGFGRRRRKGAQSSW